MRFSPDIELDYAWASCLASRALSGAPSQRGAFPTGLPTRPWEKKRLRYLFLMEVQSVFMMFIVLLMFIMLLSFSSGFNLMSVFFQRVPGGAFELYIVSFIQDGVT